MVSYFKIHQFTHLLFLRVNNNPRKECVQMFHNFRLNIQTHMISGSSKYVGSNQLDPENHSLEVNHWQDDSKGYSSQYTTSAKHCFPVSESYYYSLRGPQARKFLARLKIKPDFFLLITYLQLSSTFIALLKFVQWNLLLRQLFF